ncbi:MAG TPA: hypothetical protein ENI23_15965 [bacterium]|nr:hypothetical protein [bacterium]
MAEFKYYIITWKQAAAGLGRIEAGPVTVEDGKIDIPKSLSLHRFEKFLRAVWEGLEQKERGSLLKVCEEVYHRHLMETNPGPYMEYITALWLLAISKGQNIQSPEGEVI